MAVPSPDALEALEKLSNDPKNVVYIISGRDSAFLDQHLGHLTKIGFSAEHGSFVKEPSTDGKPSSWTNLTESLDMSWMSEVKEVFEYYTERTTGSFVEMKKSSVTWHYRASDPDWGCVLVDRLALSDAADVPGKSLPVPTMSRPLGNKCCPQAAN